MPNTTNNTTTERGTNRDQYNQSLSENLITLLCLDEKYGKLIANLITPELFANDLQRLMVSRAQDYWREHHQPPGKAHVFDLVDDLVGNRRHPRAEPARQIIRDMLQLHHGNINGEYVLSQLNTYRNYIQYRNAIAESAELMDSRQHLAIPEIEEKWGRILRDRYKTEQKRGLSLGNLDVLVNYMTTRADREFDTGIIPLDRHHVVPSRKTLMILLGPSSAGKSWYLINIGKRAMRAGKRVLHVTLELSGEETMLRYHQNLLTLAVDEKDLKTKITTLRLAEEDGKLIGFDREEVTAAFSFKDPEWESKLRAAWQRSNQLNNLQIEHFPMQSLTVSALRGVIEQNSSLGFVPDLLLLDYVGVMKHSGDNKRIELGRVVEELRGLADEYNIAVVTACQVNREAQSKFVTRTSIAEDFSMVCTADIVLTLSKTDLEKQHKVARVYVDKGRHTKQDFGAVINQNYEHGQFAINSAWLASDYEQLLERFAEQTDRRPTTRR